MIVGKTKILLQQGDITKQDVDAIVNAANSGLRGGGGVDGAIHRVGGSSIMRACEQIRHETGGCPTGEAVATGAGALPADWVIHTVGPIWQGGDRGEAEKLRSAYTNSLRVAAEKGAKTIAFPSISTGIYGYPIEEACRIALQAVIDFCQGDSHFEEVRFILFSAHDYALYEQQLLEMEKKQ